MSDNHDPGLKIKNEKSEKVAERIEGPEKGPRT